MAIDIFFFLLTQIKQGLLDSRRTRFDAQIQTFTSFTCE